MGISRAPKRRKPLMWLWRLDFPLGRKREAFLLGAHLILLYFIRVLLSTPKTFLLFLVFLVGGGWAVFLAL